MCQRTREEEIELAWAQHWSAQPRPREGWLEKLYKKYNGTCLYCEAELSLDATNYALRPTIDHFVPLAQGGADELDNCVLACALCNAAKGDLSPFDAHELFKRREAIKQQWHWKRLL